MMEAMPRVDHGEEALASDNGLLLRNVELTDVDAYVRMRCDPAMMTELGGPLPREGIEDKVARDAAEGAAGSSLIKMIVPGGAAPGVVAGSVVMWQHDEGDGARLSEIGWMVLPEFQGQGVGKRAVRMLLELAGQQDHWGLVHAYPAITNAPSNGICRSLGFTFAAERDLTFAGHVLRCNDWYIDPGSLPPA
jgi:RimJ/RimL family protein N-acetyltransferase